MKPADQVLKFKPQSQTTAGFPCSQLWGFGQYEELLVEMGDYTTPFQSSPPWMQLMVLLTFNTALFVANALLEKLFHVDILPIVGMMTGASPLDGTPTATAPRPPPRPTPTPSPNQAPKQAPVPKPEAPASFAAFASNFQAPTQ